ncbi:DUF6922 domain-containing protein [Aequorivita flava]|uniref:DUF6922 domain-containing protein n=1 Tax=Aequorivita flava TaxID=3114371 RepID=A0AB35YRJ8_9FLAO
MAAVHSISHLSEHLFWDVDKAELDFEKSKEFIIHRVLEYGLMEDWELIKEIYGLETIKQISLQFRELDAVTLSFLSAIFKIDKKEFRCYTNKTSMPSFWNS